MGTPWSCSLARNVPPVGFKAIIPKASNSSHTVFRVNHKQARVVWFPYTKPQNVTRGSAWHRWSANRSQASCCLARVLLAASSSVCPGALRAQMDPPVALPIPVQDQCLLPGFSDRVRAGGTGGGLLQHHAGDKPRARGTPQGHRWCLAARTMGWDAHGIVSITREQAAQQSCQQQAGEGERNGASVP